MRQTKPKGDGNPATLMNSIPLQWKPFALAYTSPFSQENRLVVSSFETEKKNAIKVFRIVGPSIISESSTTLTFPQTCVRFSPNGSRDASDIFISCGDNLKVWQASLDGVNLTNEIVLNNTNDPITCADWSLYEESLALAGASDATATAVDLSTGQAVARIIAHDHPVLDISFCGPSSTFITAGFDGSLRFFDLRDLQSSFIYYQTSMPLLRATVSTMDCNKVATFSKNSTSVTIIDSRRPGVPCAIANGHSSSVSCIGWSKLQPDTIFSSDISGALISSNIVDDSLSMDCYSKYNSNGAIESFVVGQNVISLAKGTSIEVLGGFISSHNSKPNLMKMFD